MTNTVILLCLLAGPLLVGELTTRITGRALATRALLGCLGLTLVFGLAGVAHFVVTEAMSRMLPPWVPARILLVQITGVLELALAFAVLSPRLRVSVGWMLILLLVLFFPVNVYAAFQRVELGGHEWGPIYLLLRTPLQALLVAWTWWFAVRPSADEPIVFTCKSLLPLDPTSIAEQILDLARWPEFDGYGPLPGILEAKFEERTKGIEGSRIRVTNRDNSTHIEEIIKWEIPNHLSLRLSEFSAPVRHLATHFTEHWSFVESRTGTEVVRSLELHPRNAITRPLLWLISLLLKRAIQKHLNQLRDSA